MTIGLATAFMAPSEAELIKRLANPIAQACSTPDDRLSGTHTAEPGSVSRGTSFAIFS